jgi:membrane protease YdiL (CAAX protease family)
MKREPGPADAINAFLISIATIAIVNMLLKPDIFYTLLINAVAIITAIFIYISLVRLRPILTLNLTLPSIRSFVLTIIIWLSSIWILIFINNLQEILFRSFGLDFTPHLKMLEKDMEPILFKGAGIAILFIGVLPALSEELLFRGIILNGFKHEFGGLRALIYSSLIFALMHALIPRMVITFFLGIMFGIVVRLSGSVILAMILHLLNNMLAIFLLQRQDIFERTNVLLVIASLICFVLSCLLLYLEKRELKP